MLNRWNFITNGRDLSPGCTKRQLRSRQEWPAHHSCPLISVHRARDVFFLTSWLELLLLKNRKMFLRTFTSTKDQGQLDDQCPKTTSLGWEDVSSLWWTAMGVSETTSSAVKTHSYHLIYSCLSPRPVKPVAWKGNTHSLQSPGHYPPLIKTWDILLACYTQVFAMALSHSWRGLSHISSTKFIKQA